MGIAKGLICDESLNDKEIHFLNHWLTKHENISLPWPGSVLYARLKAMLADDVITEDERTYLTETLQKLVGGTLEELSEQGHVADLRLIRASRSHSPTRGSDRRLRVRGVERVPRGD